MNFSLSYSPGWVNLYPGAFFLTWSQHLTVSHSVLNAYSEGRVIKGKNSLTSVSRAEVKENTGQLFQDRCAST